MTDQPSLLDWTPAHQRHSDTSHAAAMAIRAKIGPLRFKIREFLRGCGACGATDEEMQEILEMPQNTQRPRRRELQMKGLIVDSGRTRPTRSGRQAVVWVLAKEGA